MGFKIVVVDGEDRTTVHEVEDRRVTKVHVLTRSGEAATIGIDPDQTDIALSFEYQAAGQLNVTDLDKVKLGYEQNLTGEEVQRREEKLNEIRGAANTGGDTFTQEAVDAQRKAEEAAAKEAETEEDRTEALAVTEEPPYEGEGRGDIGAADRGLSLGDEKGITVPSVTAEGDETTGDGTTEGDDNFTIEEPANT